MKKDKMLLKYILWLVIISSSMVLVSSSYREIRRVQASKRLSELIDEEEVISSSLIDEELAIELDKVQVKYSNIVNPQKKWIDINSDYQGWLDMAGTKIDYPVVRSLDNRYYLDRDFFKEKSEAGSIFMDYRNIGNFLDKHTAIYGHYRKNGEMFADLHKYKEKDFAMENNIVSFNSIYDEKDFKIFSVYVDSADDYQLKFNFEDDLDYMAYLEDLSGLSIHEFDFDLDPEKLLITIATCSYEIGNGRLIVHAIEI